MNDYFAEHGPFNEQAIVLPDAIRLCIGGKIRPLACLELLCCIEL